MITVISGTNRPNSKTKIIAQYVCEYLQKRGEQVQLLDLQEIAHLLVTNDMYNGEAMHEDLQKIQDQKIIAANKWVIISPEYNGSFSGIFKLFVDAISVRKYAQTFSGKKVALVGVASGRAGNLRGMEHLTGFLNYLKMHVFPVKVPLSQINETIIDGQVQEEKTKDLQMMLEGFISM